MSLECERTRRIADVHVGLVVVRARDGLVVVRMHVGLVVVRARDGLAVVRMHVGFVDVGASIEIQSPPSYQNYAS